MHGNRDFLAGERFAAAARARLLPDPHVIEQGGVRTLLLHGDTLCVDDPDYQAFRTKVRASAWQRDFLAKPLAERRAIARQLRADSRSSQQVKADAIMDVAPAAVLEAFRRHDCTRMIHGHTHRPARHEYTVDGRACERWVLAEWYATGSFLRCDPTGRCEAVSLPTTAQSSAPRA
jgi:UDP-2,3-diacylglucosamine hydrolase